MVEVARIQSFSDLEDKLIKYIVGSQGCIKFAFGVKLYQYSLRVRVVAFAPDTEGDKEIERLVKVSDDAGDSNSQLTAFDEVHGEVRVIDEDVVEANGTVRKD